jgi:SAM-dependent methyltransferase
VKFAGSIGLQVFRRDLVEDDVDDLPKVDFVWAAAVLEHVTSPHVFLRRSYLLLRPKGLIAVYVPTIPPVPAMRRLPKVGKYFRAHATGDHVNAFVPATVRFFCERAGFETLEVSAFYPPPLAALSALPVLRGLKDGVFFIGRRIDGWDYPATSGREPPNLGQVSSTERATATAPSSAGGRSSARQAHGGRPVLVP